MSLALTGMRVAYTMGAAGATNLAPQLFQAQPTLLIGVTPQAITTQQAGPAVDVALPATHELSTAAMVARDPLSALQSPFALDQLAHEKQLADAVNAHSDQLWSLAVRFFANPEAFTLKLAGNESKTDAKRYTAPVIANGWRLTPKGPVPAAKQPRCNWSKLRDCRVARPRRTPRNDTGQKSPQHLTKTEIAIALTGDSIPVKNVSLKLPRLSKASATASTGGSSTQAAPEQNSQLKSNAVVTTATSPVKSIFPYSNAQLDHARVVLHSAGVSSANAGERNSSEVSRAKASDSLASAGQVCKVFRPHAAPRHLRHLEACLPAGRESLTPDKAPSHPFQRTQVVGPAFLVGNIKTQKARKADPAQIVRVATNGSTKRRIVFTRVPGTRGEYRFVGVDHQQKTRGQRESTVPHALTTPHAERALHRSGLGLAPPTAAGETAYTMPDPRELREDERKALVSMLKEQLALGPASLNDHSIRERFNDFMFSNTVGEMSHYITADQWNGMVHATVLYAARTVLPFSNNSIAQTAASQLFDGEDAQSRYAEWNEHFGITRLGDVAMVDTFLADDRILTMPEYFLKGIMDHLMERAQELQGYDEGALPLPFTTELHLQWETIGFIHDPAISNDAQLIEAATSFAEEIAALDPYAAQHFLELVLLSTLVKTDSIQGVWNEDQAVALIGSSIEAGLSDIVNAIGKDRSFPRRVRRLIAIAKEKLNSAVDAENRYEAGLRELTATIARAAEDNPEWSSSTDPSESEELRAN